MLLRLLVLSFFSCLPLLAQLETPFIGGVWSGNVSSTSGTVAIRLTSPSLRVRLHVSTNPALNSPVYSPFVTTSGNLGHTAKLTVQGLQPDTDYYYGVEVAGVLRSEPESRGRFRTFPFGRGSFKIAFASCGDYRHANQSAYDAILRERPLLFIVTGDLHYSDTNSTVADDYRLNYDGVLSHPNQAALFRGVPVAYVWDDHDFSGNDSDTTAAGRDTARAVFRERVPHYPIGAAGGAVAQAFTIGRVRVIMTDLRSASSPYGQRESASKSRMGASQKIWFKQELINARDGGFPLVLWVSPDPWIAPASLGDDSWGGHSTERTEIANFIRDNRVNNVVMLSGDMHGLAYDDGSNSDYATGGGAKMVVLHAAALTADASNKGGPYSGGAIPGSQQYGILEVYDTGGPSVACRFLGMHARDGQKMSFIFSASAAGNPQHALVNISTLSRVASETDPLVSGFVISGTSDRAVLVRAVGPTLAGFGVSDPLMRPQLAVFQGSKLVATNEAWGGSTEQVDRMTGAFDRAGAFRLIDTDSRDAALFLSLPPGPYTVQVSSGDGRPGAALLEVYDLP
ncbi:MAG: alkaline phosphatase D family protein [Opitutaceae bacterium]|nr:alkaline phosphatase D family protein [Opitutaceae bacterium]